MDDDDIYILTSPVDPSRPQTFGGPMVSGSVLCVCTVPISSTHSTPRSSRAKSTALARHSRPSQSCRSADGNGTTSGSSGCAGSATSKWLTVNGTPGRYRGDSKNALVPYNCTLVNKTFRGSNAPVFVACTRRSWSPPCVGHVS